jgi:hypothetical protein
MNEVELRSVFLKFKTTRTKQTRNITKTRRKQRRGLRRTRRRRKIRIRRIKIIIRSIKTKKIIKTKEK